MKHIRCAAAVCLLVSISLLVAYHKRTLDYGVFIGAEATRTKNYNHYDNVVVEPSDLTFKQVSDLKKDGHDVYAYLNVGSLENTQPYYSQYRDILLDRYDGWPGERWADVTQPKWQRLVVQDLARSYREQGFTGLFIDNTDVYYHYHTPAVYNALKSMMRSLKQMGFKLIINGGDMFISDSLRDGSAAKLYDGVNQEDVFTTYDFDTKKYGRQDREDTAYYENYLAKAKAAGLDVYIIEYRVGRELSKKIDDYCGKRGYKWYNAKSINLD